MNKGRNIAILMCCLLSLSVLTLLMFLTRGNDSGVVDRARYVLESADDYNSYYDFYFEGEEIMEGTVIINEDGSRDIEIYLRVYDSEEQLEEEEGEIFYSLEKYAYSYHVTGTERDDAVVTFVKNEDGEVYLEEKEFERFSENFFVTMIFGKEPLLLFWEAVLVAAIAALGGAIIFYSEELWHLVNKKGEEEIPKWEDMTIYKRIGGGVIAFAVLILMLFVII